MKHRRAECNHSWPTAGHKLLKQTNLYDTTDFMQINNGKHITAPFVAHNAHQKQPNSRTNAPSSRPARTVWKGSNWQKNNPNTNDFTFDPFSFLKLRTSQLTVILVFCLCSPRFFFYSFNFKANVEKFAEYLPYVL